MEFLFLVTNSSITVVCPQKEVQKWWLSVGCAHTSVRFGRTTFLLDCVFKKHSWYDHSKSVCNLGNFCWRSPLFWIILVVSSFCYHWKNALLLSIIDLVFCASFVLHNWKSIVLFVRLTNPLRKSNWPFFVVVGANNIHFLLGVLPQ